MPENTIESFRSALLAGADGIESDLHCTRDGKIILLHDARLDRTTTGSGNVAEMDYVGVIDQMVTLKQPAQKIPLFSEALELIQQPEFSKAVFNVR